MRRRTILKLCCTAPAVFFPSRRAELHADDRFDSRSTQVAIGNSVVATVHSLASQAAAEILEAGGNAIDATVGAAMVLSVVDGHNSGLGGGCFILVRKANGDFLAIDGRETAPRLAHRDMFVINGEVQSEASLTGPLAVGIPGMIAATYHVHQTLGKLSWKQVLAPSIAIAREGFPIGNALATAIRAEAQAIRRFAATSTVLLDDKQVPKKVGQQLVQRDLAETLEQVAIQGPRWFYEGPFAQLASRHLREAGGIISESDFAQYEVKRREPIVSRYRGHSILGFPSPSSGGIHIAQMLTMLEAFDLRSMYVQQPQIFYHLIAEAMKLAFADRAFWLGDADFTDVPRGLTDPAYCRQLSQKIREDQAVEVRAAGQPDWSLGRFDEKKHTTHLTTVDAEGNWVAMTSTVNTSFGCKMMVPGTGVILNNQMDDFSIAPGTPNAFGLVGAERNAIAPGKRPLSSMSPTIVLDANGQPILTCGAAGGPRIITSTLMNLIRVIDLQQSIDEAIRSPRIHHQWLPDELCVEASLDASIVEGLRSLGHSIRVLRSSAIAQGIQSWKEGQKLGASDPRTDSRAIAVG